VGRCGVPLPSDSFGRGSESSRVGPPDFSFISFNVVFEAYAGADRSSVELMLGFDELAVARYGGDEARKSSAEVERKSLAVKGWSRWSPSRCGGACSRSRMMGMCDGFHAFRSGQSRKMGLWKENLCTSAPLAILNFLPHFCRLIDRIGMAVGPVVGNVDNRGCLGCCLNEDCRHLC
jgi:hypothetical protein